MGTQLDRPKKKTGKRKRIRPLGCDMTVLFIVPILVLFGVVMIFSSSYYYTMTSAKYGYDMFYFPVPGGLPILLRNETRGFPYGIHMRNVQYCESCSKPKNGKYSKFSIFCNFFHHPDEAERKRYSNSANSGKKCSTAFAMLYLTLSEPSLRLCHPIAQGYRIPSRRNAAYL